MVMDEISKLEAAAVGHADTLRKALETLRIPLVLSVRGDQLFYVVEKFRLEDYVAGSLEIPAAQEAIEGFADMIVGAAVEHRDYWSERFSKISRPKRQ
jgi:hypothetical protein